MTARIRFHMVFFALVACVTWSVVAEPREKREGVGIYLALRCRPGGIGFEFAAADFVQDGLAENRARRVAGAEEKDVEGLIRLVCAHHELLLPTAFFGGTVRFAVSGPQHWAANRPKGAQISGRPPQQSLVR